MPQCGAATAFEASKTSIDMAAESGSGERRIRTSYRSGRGDESWDHEERGFQRAGILGPRTARLKPPRFSPTLLADHEHPSRRAPRRRLDSIPVDARAHACAGVVSQI